MVTKLSPKSKESPSPPPQRRRKERPTLAKQALLLTAPYVPLSLSPLLFLLPFHLPCHPAHTHFPIKQVDEARRKLDEGDALLTQKAREAQAKAQQLKAGAGDKLKTMGKETEKDFHQVVDNFDKTVERKTSEAKSGISSWFGFGK